MPADEAASTREQQQDDELLRKAMGGMAAVDPLLDQFEELSDLRIQDQDAPRGQDGVDEKPWAGEPRETRLGDLEARVGELAEERALLKAQIQARRRRCLGVHPLHSTVEPLVQPWRQPPPP